MASWIDRLLLHREGLVGGTAVVANSFQHDEMNLRRLGRTGLRLLALSNIGLPVQPGFIISADICRHVHETGLFPDEFDDVIAQELAHLKHVRTEHDLGRQLPFCVTVSTSTLSNVAGVASPIFHVGMCDAIADQLCAIMADTDNETGNASWQSASIRAAGQYLRFLYQFSENALGVTPDLLEDLIDQKTHQLGFKPNDHLTHEHLKQVASDYKELLKNDHDITFPEGLEAQVKVAAKSAIRSWMSRRAAMQRQIQEIDDGEGLAVIVKHSLFGDFDDLSGQGYIDTRNPKTGQKHLSGGFTWGAVGEQNVATSQFEVDLGLDGTQTDDRQKRLVDLKRQLTQLANSAETYFGKGQRLSIVSFSGECFVYDAENLKLSPEAELKISVDLALEGVISKEEALARVDPISLEQLLHPSLDADMERTVIASGVSASPGAACGEIVFSSEEVIRAHREGRKTILVRTETSPEDVQGMQRSEGILTIRGGTTSHAAVIARGMGIPCVCGANSLRINLQAQTLIASGRMLRSGDVITLDGTKGEVLLGELAMREPTLSPEFQTLMSWADDMRRLEVRTNAEAPEDVQIARQFGAQGVGLCRTEHMFFEDDRIFAMREMILAETEDGRRAALDRLLPMQESDFLELFKAANGQPITIRLLDPPLHEFLPQGDDEITQTAKAIGVDEDMIRRRIAELREFNPMLGHRGCRLAISYPEITEMQARAIIRAAIDAGHKTGSPVVPEIMVPLVAMKEELDFVKERIDFVAKEVMAEKASDVHYLVGTMIELPRAIIRAGDIAEISDFFSFGTNDLTQMTFGISRDDASPFLKTYRQKAIIDDDPFTSLDFDAIGEMISMAIDRGRATDEHIKLGVCGEHGGDPRSVKFFDQVGLDYVSCSPYRVPIAKLAAAQSQIKGRRSP